MSSPFQQSLVFEQHLRRRLGLTGAWSPTNPNEHPLVTALKAQEGAPWGAQSPFLAALLAQRDNGVDADLPDALLTRIDGELVEITRRLGVERWLYFQYLSMLFAAVALELLYADRPKLLEALNVDILRHNRKLKGAAGAGRGKKSETGALPPLTERGLMRLCCWQATGSGKTLLLHAHRLLAERAARRYAAKNKADHPLALDLQPAERVILLAPSQSLLDQHVQEAALLGVSVRPYQPGLSLGLRLVREQELVGLTIHQLTAPGAKATENKVPPEMFEGRNLVLVDEGHRGSSKEDGQWRQIREALGRDGLTLEYSATFEQAANNATGLFGAYAASVFFDYSYARFYRDGYGKHHRVLNLTDAADGGEAEAYFDYMTAAITAFYQQLYVFERDEAEMARYGVARPLLLFAGRTVLGVDKDDASGEAPEQTDVVKVLRFFMELLAGDAVALRVLGDVLAGRANLLTRRNEDLFRTWFPELPSRDAATVHADLLRRVFRATKPGRLVLDLLTHKDAQGEVGLRVEGGEPFGVINVGDPAGLVRRLEATGGAERVIVRRDPLAPSLFKQLKRDDCALTMLVGSKKFAEGWSSWRVSQIGLLNIGRGVGTQVIQLFGRGVRLRGKDGSLKRTSPGWDAGDLSGDPTQSRLRVVETLNVFAVNGTYLQQFKDAIHELGIDTPEPDAPEAQYTFTLRVSRQRDHAGLRVPVEPDAEAFARLVDLSLDPAPPIPLSPPIPLGLEPPQNVPQVTLDYTPRVEQAEEVRAEVQERRATLELLMALVDHDAIHRRLVALKSSPDERSRLPANLALPARVIDSTGKRIPLSMAILRERQEHFTVRLPPRYIDPAEVADLSKRALWQELAETLVITYAIKLVEHVRRRWSTHNSTLSTLDAVSPKVLDGAVFDGYSAEKAAWSVTVPETWRAEADAWAKRIQRAIRDQAEGSLQLRDSGTFAHTSGPSLYYPLVSQTMKSQEVNVRPVALNVGEHDLVALLTGWLNKPAGRAWLGDGEVMLLRNIAKSGFGFFVGEGFYPDFLLWVRRGERQWLTFIDPKGLLNLAGEADGKVQLYADLACVEARLGGGKTFFDSWLWSVTSREDVKKAAFQQPLEALHIVFAQDGEGALETMLARCHASKV